MAKPNEPQATRRDVLKVAGAVVAGPLAAVRGAAAATTAAAFFTPEEFRLVDELSELILPADEHSPGARAAQVAAYIDQQLHETVVEEERSQWRDGLKGMDALSQQMHGAEFLKASPQQRVAVLSRLAEHEEKPQTPEERFFGELKSRTTYAYYTSKIGIHTEMEYKGNVYQEEFAGYDAAPLQGKPE
jgi:glucoside 3-dehydrogenase (cytochrome c) hitch-hiker subunit